MSKLYNVSLKVLVGDETPLASRVTSDTVTHMLDSIKTVVSAVVYDLVGDGRVKFGPLESRTNSEVVAIYVQPTRSLNNRTFGFIIISPIDDTEVTRGKSETGSLSLPEVRENAELWS